MAKLNLFGILFALKILLESYVIARDDNNTPQINESKHTVCYGELGCFNSLPPFHPEMPLPFGPKRLGTKFFLHTRQNRENGDFLEANQQSVLQSHFNPSVKTKIIIHGFVVSNTELASWVPKVTQAILDKEDANVIIVNWVDGARLTYDQAVSNTRVVGAQIGYLIKNLMEYHHVKPADFHIIGFSLGAHVAGFAGKSVKSVGPKMIIGRITGLDPANPGFNSDSHVVRLDKSDAKFVDVIHTDTSTLLFTASGLKRNIGHADYYPNGGASQPGCSGDWSDNNSTWFSSVTELTVCDHLRAPRLFMNSINMTKACTFTSYRCKSYEKFKEGKCIRCSNGDSGRHRCSVMGYWAEPPRTKKQVQYYLQTTGEAPFCVKNYQVKLHWRKSAKPTKGFKAKLFVTLIGDKGSTEETALNDGTTYHINAGETTRFLVTIGCQQDIGQIRRVVFRWERPLCWLWFMCSTENIFLRQIKVIDGTKQKQNVFMPLRTEANHRRRVIEIQSGESVEFLRKSYVLNTNTITSNEIQTHGQVVEPELTSIDKPHRRKHTMDNTRRDRLHHKMHDRPQLHNHGNRISNEIENKESLTLKSNS